MKDYRSPNSHRIPYLLSLKGSLVLSLTTEPRLSHGGDFLSIYSGAPTRAHTLTQVHQGGRRGGHFWCWPTFQPLPTLTGQQSLTWVFQVDFTTNGAVREIHDPGGES